MRRALALLLLTGCFPYRELYRPDINGRVLDGAGAAVSGAEVKACSYSKWFGPGPGCPRATTSVTDADGGFAFEELKEWDWCCLGEAPMPLTEVFVCSADGGASLVASSHGWPKQPVVLRLSGGSPRCP